MSQTSASHRDQREQPSSWNSRTSVERQQADQVQHAPPRDQYHQQYTSTPQKSARPGSYTDSRTSLQSDQQRGNGYGQQQPVHQQTRYSPSTDSKTNDRSPRAQVPTQQPPPQTQGRSHGSYNTRQYAEDLGNTQQPQHHQSYNKHTHHKQSYQY